MSGWTKITVTPADTEIREAENMLLEALDKYISTDGDDAVSVSEEALNFVGALLSKPSKQVHWSKRFLKWLKDILCF